MKMYIFHFKEVLKNRSEKLGPRSLSVLSVRFEVDRTFENSLFINWKILVFRGVHQVTFEKLPIIMNIYLNLSLFDIL